VYRAYLVYCVCTVTDFSAAEKDRSVQFCMRVRILSGQVFSHYGGRRSKVNVTRNKKTRLALPTPTRMRTNGMRSLQAHAAAACGTGGRAHFLAGEGWHRRRRAARLVRGFGITHDTCWAFGTGAGRRCLRAYGGICVLQACWRTCCLKAKFHYASWFEAGSKLVADRFEAGRWSPTSFKPVCDQLRTSFEPERTGIWL